MKQEKNKTETISIIIPVYNVNKYLPGLFQNLAGQNLEDAEVIFIDDGSTDGSSELLDELSANTSYTVRHQKNQGVAAARNYALDIASGKYLIFIDPDDSISDDFINRLKKSASETDADVLITDWHEVMDDGTEVVHSAKARLPLAPTPQDVLGEILGGGQILGSLWGKMFAARLFTDNRFPPQRTCSDFVPTITAIGNADIIAFVPDIYYGYVSDRGTSLQHNQRAQDVADSVFVHKESGRFVLRRYPDLVTLSRLDMANSCIQACINICMSEIIESETKKKLFKKYRKQVTKNLSVVLLSKGALKHKIMSLCVAGGYLPTQWALLSKSRAR